MTHAETTLLTRHGASMTRGAEDDLSMADLTRHRNKLGITLNRKAPGAPDVMRDLIARCDVVVDNFSRGTLDKLEALPGYRATPDRAALLHTLRDAGCAIVGASARIAPADRRLYAIRDATGTVESLPLITASILSKKLAAGVQRLLIDVKLGNGAFCTRPDEARALAESLVMVASEAGLPTRALITDMNAVLGTSAGNALRSARAWPS
jgi:thymidine phosphorylase